MADNMATNIAATLALKDNVLYETWKKEIHISQMFTTLKPDKKALGYSCH